MFRRHISAKALTSKVYIELCISTTQTLSNQVRSWTEAWRFLRKRYRINSRHARRFPEPFVIRAMEEVPHHIWQQDCTVGENVEKWGGSDPQVMGKRIQLPWRATQGSLSKSKLLSSKFRNFIQKNRESGYGGDIDSGICNMTTFWRSKMYKWS